MADYITKIRTTEGDKQIDYNGLANKPESLKNPSALTVKGAFPVTYDGSSPAEIEIPDCANAIKGTASGEVVRVDDVSPIEHTAKVNVHGKNLVDISTAQPLDRETVEVNGDNIVFKNFGENHFGCRFADIPLSIGKTYTFSVESIALKGSGFGWRIMYEDGTSTSTSNANTLTVTIDKKVKWVNFYIAFGDLTETQDITVSKPMCELGTEATAYEPYISPSTIALTKCGKNLVATNEFEVNKPATPWASANLDKIKIAPGNYVASCNFKQVGTDKSEIALSIRDYDNYSVVLSGAISKETGGKLVAPFTVKEGQNGFQVYVYSNMTAEALSADCIFTNIMVEAGTTATDFEAYKGETYTPNADGTFDVVSVSPTMTFSTDTEDAIVEVEYNKDTEKAIKEYSVMNGDGVVASPNADFAEVAEWSDGNPDNEDRIGYFVCFDVPTTGIIMRKANADDDAKGVTVANPSFAGNCTKDKFDENGKLLPQYEYVGVIGLVPVHDNGQCVVGGRCIPADGGLAAPSPNDKGYQVVERYNDDMILIAVEPNGDMVYRLQAQIDALSGASGVTELTESANVWELPSGFYRITNEADAEEYKYVYFDIDSSQEPLFNGLVVVEQDYDLGLSSWFVLGSSEYYNSLKAFGSTDISTFQLYENFDLADMQSTLNLTNSITKKSKSMQYPNAPAVYNLFTKGLAYTTLNEYTTTEEVSYIKFIGTEKLNGYYLKLEIPPFENEIKLDFSIANNSYGSHLLTYDTGIVLQPTEKTTFVHVKFEMQLDGITAYVNCSGDNKVKLVEKYFTSSTNMYGVTLYPGGNLPVGTKVLIKGD